MPCVPREQRDAYRQWAKDNAKAQMDQRAWVHEADYSAFLSVEPGKLAYECGRPNCTEHVRHGRTYCPLHDFPRFGNADADAEQAYALYEQTGDPRLRTVM